jgi:hypothetical protein
MKLAEKTSEISAAKTRLQFDFNEAMLDLLNRIRNETNATTRAEVVRRAVSLYALLWDEFQDGKQLLIVDNKSGEKQRVILAP